MQSQIPLCNSFEYSKTLFVKIIKYPTKYLQVILGGLFYNESVGLLSDLPAESANIDKSNWQARQQEISSFLDLAFI